jgi:hypothetical protein
MRLHGPPTRPQVLLSYEFQPVEEVREQPQSSDDYNFVL